MIIGAGESDWGSGQKGRGVSPTDVGVLSTAGLGKLK